MSFLRQLPRYQCHKQVSALKIRAVVPNPRGFELHFCDERFAPHEVPSPWVGKHSPDICGDADALVGGYLVVHEDGHQSWSPAAAFEPGYTLLPEPVAAACQGANCGATDGNHSPECLDEAALNQGWADFALAIRALKDGKRVARSGWNGRGMWLVLVGGHDYRLGSDAVFALGLQKLPWIGMKTADECFVPWLASQTDMLAADWCALD